MTNDIQAFHVTDFGTKCWHWVGHRGKSDHFATLEQAQDDLLRHLAELGLELGETSGSVYLAVPSRR